MSENMNSLILRNRFIYILILWNYNYEITSDDLLAHNALQSLTDIRILKDKAILQ